MSVLGIWDHSLDHPKLLLMLWFTLWKLLLLCVALISPGPGYDTSTILFHSNPDLIDPTAKSKAYVVASLSKLVRWDAIYFVEIARRGYSWEQEWAFGWGFTKLLALVSKGRPNLQYI